MHTDVAAMSKRMPSPVRRQGLWILHQVAGGGRGVVGFCCAFVLMLPPAAMIRVPYWPVVFFVVFFLLHASTPWSHSTVSSDLRG